MVQPFLQESNPAFANPIKGSLFTDPEIFVQEFKEIFVQMPQQIFVQRFKDISSFQRSQNLFTQFETGFCSEIQQISLLGYLNKSLFMYQKSLCFEMELRRIQFASKNWL